MKRVILRSCATVLFASLLGVCGAAEPGKKKAPKAAGQSAPAEKTGLIEENRVLTGSHLKSKYKRNGLITDGQSEVLVLDSQTIANSGASDLRELLCRRGLRR